MKRFDFYFKYAWRSVLRGGQRSFFALLCVAVGVAALVALQSLAVSIRETLTNDIQIRAGGDLTGRINSYNNSNISTSPQAQQYLDRLKSKGEILDWTTLSNSTLQIRGYFGFPPTVYVVDPAHFPLYGKVELVEPKGGDFQALLSQPNTIVLSTYLVEKNEYKIGQEIEVSGSSGITSNGKSAKLKLVGVVKPDVPGITFDSGFIFGFGIVSQQAANGFIQIDTGNRDTNVYFKVPPTTNIPELIKDLNEAKISDDANVTRGIFYNLRTAEQLQEQISKNLVYVDDLLSYVGLLAILIGGLGVINTMLVVIGRRTTEIATIKALGLKTRQTLAIFTIEALILGSLGSILGVILGVGLGFGVKGVAEGLFFRPLNWGIYPTPILIGLFVGILTSGVFGFLPSYAAARVRPGVVLRQQAGTLPNIGGIATFVIVILMTIALGLVGGILLRNELLGVIIAFGTLVACSLMTAFMYLIVLLVGFIPIPFSLSLRMAVRNFSRHRGRTATTLLVMTAGLFFITFIVIIADSIKTSFRQTFDFNLGFNVVAANLLGGQTEQIQSSLQKDVPGVQKVFASNNSSAEVLKVNGAKPELKLIVNPDGTTRGASYSVSLSGRTLANGESISPNGPQTLRAGRTFQPEDMTKPVLLIDGEEADSFGIKVGDKVTLELKGLSLGGAAGGRPNPTGPATASRQVEFEVIGITNKATATTIQFERGWVAPFSIVGQGGNTFSIIYMLIDRAQMKPALTKAQSLLVGGFVIDISDLVDAFTRILDQVLAFPLLLSMLSLFSGAILIANNVALSVLERQTEIGVLKAIGAKRRRVLTMLLWEGSLIGLLGGLLGIGTGIILAILVPILTARPNVEAPIAITWSPLTAILLLGLGIGLAIIATIVSAWSAVQEKPLVVLRYE